ncbi:PREDICTED: uncharacterized protein At4g38062-like isoform X3 [Lupinus angustifolius]|uniref:uncharacterized protein At4g38062-like isoform X2 n=1 Tax=Lupinus angustifolius TaxID=3871 RepID=UPI00092F09FD|nr:PREDICTED: uncharacterized protein At4g38062-like isoform X2 [Lupinus angustifolius]XP_019439234.1 PREDICTED: uncharacterized protein At4g38062-like isoform X3 [Lupinus angustifolius]
MDKVYEELDEAKTEIEKLKAELRDKTDSFERLKKSHDVYVNQKQEAKCKAEKLDEELRQKADEIAEGKQMYEDVKVNLHRKESIIKDLSAAIDKLRADCDEKFRMWEHERGGLVSALEEANEKAEKQEQQIYVYRQEIESLRGCLSVSKKKCSKMEKDLKASIERSERDEMFHKLEEEKRKLEDQLKWKKEQFKHLEEAHEKLRDQFRSSKKEWEMDKSALLDEISSQQIKLDSQIRISEDLRHRLQSCNQALAHVESQKKRLEVEVSDFKAQFDNGSSEYRGARFQLDSSNSQHDEDIAELRYSLTTKEAKYKESKYRTKKLEQENQELKMSIKELQEAQIQAYSHSKLRSKLRNLEQVHQECAPALQAKEAEWKFQLEQLTGELNSCRSALETKITAIEGVEMDLKRSQKECASILKAKEAVWNIQLKQLAGELNSCQSELETKVAAVEELKMELERSHSLTIEMKLLNEEMSVMLLVLRQGISEAQLELKDAALISARNGINEEHERAACLTRQVESFEFNMELQHSLQIEIDRYKEMLDESTMCQQRLEEKVMKMEHDSKEQIEEVLDALDSANIELHERICERNEMELELQIWKSFVERSQSDLEESHVMRKELETALLAQVDDGERLKQNVNELTQQVTSLETLAAFEIEEKKLMIAELEDDDVHDIQQKLKSKQLEVKELFNDQTETKLGKSNALIQKLKTENRNLLENAARLSLEKENLLSFVQGLDDKVCEFSTADTKLMDMLRSMVQSFENDACPGINLKKDDGFVVKENMLIHSPSRIKKLEDFSDIRSPFKELNS